MCDVKLTTRTVRVYLLDDGRSGAQLAPVAIAPWEKGAIWLRSLAETFFPRPLLMAPYAASVYDTLLVHEMCHTGGRMCCSDVGTLEQGTTQVSRFVGVLW
jgi:hypothetical protein